MILICLILLKITIGEFDNREMKIVTKTNLAVVVVLAVVMVAIVIGGVLIIIFCAGADSTQIGEEVELKTCVGTDEKKYSFRTRDSITFHSNEDAATVFLDHPITTGVWRVEAKFYFDESKPGTTADFGVADSSSLSRLYSKWLYNDPNTCALYLDKGSSKVTVGKTPKTILSDYNVSSGSVVAMEIDMDSRMLRFLLSGRPVPFAVKIKPHSLHVGFTGRFMQRFAAISLRRIDKSALHTPPEVIVWR